VDVGIGQGKLKELHITRKTAILRCKLPYLSSQIHFIRWWQTWYKDAECTVFEGISASTPLDPSCEPSANPDFDSIGYCKNYRLPDELNYAVFCMTVRRSNHTKPTCMVDPLVGFEMIVKDGACVDLGGRSQTKNLIFSKNRNGEAFGKSIIVNVEENFVNVMTFKDFHCQEKQGQQQVFMNQCVVYPGVRGAYAWKLESIHLA